MALNLILDAAISQLSEPGFWQWVSTRRTVKDGSPADDAAHQGLWCDEPTQTLMLRPLQLESSWLNTASQHSSIIRLAQMNVNAADISAQAIFEAAAFGNADNPYIFHVPVGPSGAFPAAQRPQFPGSAPSLVGIPVPAQPVGLPLPAFTQGPTVVFQPSLTVPPPPPAAPPAVVSIGSIADGKFLCGSQERLVANQNLFFRWFHPSSMLGFPCTYEFYVGQFCLRIKDVVVEIFRDISAGGDRTSWKKVMVAPLFSLGDLSPSGTGSVTATVRPQADLDHDRSLLWIPFRRNQVLLYSSAGKWAVLTVNGTAKRLQDDSDWEIVRSDNLLVWVLTPAAGRFQVQKAAYPAGTIKMQSPTVTLDYTPGTAPTVAITGDTDHGTTLSSVASQPPSYTLPANDASDCPKATTTTSDQRRTYGVELSFAASGDQRWTPFYYGYQISAPRAFVSSPATPTTVADVNPGPSLIGAKITAGIAPGEGRLTAEVMDDPSYPLSSYYYRCSLPLQLRDTASALNVFTGVMKEIEVTPLLEAGAHTPRRLTFSALDRWKSLADTSMRDQRDWTGYGHIDVVRFICELGGIDCTTAEFPAGYTPASPPSLANLSALNTPLGGNFSTVAQKTGDVKQFWRPRAEDTAATFIERIRDLFSDWYVGFRLDGTFFYLPKTYFTTPTVTFHSTNGGGTPRMLAAPTFTTVEPEANVIVVQTGDDKDGSVVFSAPFIDWASIQNPAVLNYLGRWRAEIVPVGGALTCPQMNYVARIIWNQTRRRHVHAQFKAEFVPTLKIGGAFTLSGYGDYRLIGFNADLDHSQTHFTHYEGELIERGY